MNARAALRHRHGNNRADVSSLGINLRTSRRTQPLSERVDGILTDLVIQSSFVGAEDADWISAVLYTIVRSCWNHGVDPYAYLRHALTRLPEMTNRQIPTITPRAYAKVQKAAAVQDMQKVA
jgi:hypothetical protein